MPVGLHALQSIVAPELGDVPFSLFVTFTAGLCRLESASQIFTQDLNLEYMTENEGPGNNHGVRADAVSDSIDGDIAA